MSLYYSNWILILFILWYVSYISNNRIAKYVNPYIALQVTCVGYTIYMIYLLFYKKLSFELSYIILVTFLHFGPLYVMYSLPRFNYGIETLVISFVVYMLYVECMNSDIYKIYIENPRPLW